MISAIVKNTSLVISYLISRPFDTTTEQGRTGERARRIALSTITGLVARIIAILIQFISVPLTLNYLGTERYGLWMTLSSVVALLGFTDLGLGNSVKNLIAHNSGKDDHHQIQRVVSSGLFVLSLIALLIILSFAFLYKHISWAVLFNLKTPSAMAEAAPVMAVLVFCFAIMLPARLVQQVQAGFQEIFQSNLWQIAASVLTLLFIIIAIKMQAGLPWLALAVAGCPVIVNIIYSVIIGIYRPWIRPKWSETKLEIVNKISRIGGLFFILQLAAVLNFQKDNIIIAHILGPEHVAGYSILVKLFSIPTMLFMLYLSPLWPAYTEANARGDKEWVIKTFQHSLKYSLIFTIPIVLIFILGGRWIIEAWAGDKVIPTLGLLIGMGIWTILFNIGNVSAMLFNGLHIVRFQVLIVVPLSIINLVLTFIFVNKIGVVGAITGTILAYFFVSTIPVFIYLKRLGYLDGMVSLKFKRT